MTSHLSPRLPHMSGLLSSPRGPAPHPLLSREHQTSSHRGRGCGPCRRGGRRGPAHGSSHEPETYGDGEVWDGVGGGYRAGQREALGWGGQRENCPRGMRGGGK